MIDVVGVAIAVGIFVIAARAWRRRKLERVQRAQTVSLVIDGLEARRVLGDGRTESVRWAQARSVEVVCTPVKTADGASAFALIAESDTEGCLVPLGVGYDDALTVRLSELPGFRTERYSAAVEERPPCRTIIWTRPTA